MISGRYYLYSVKSIYDKTVKRSRKVSLGILGRVTQEEGFIPSEKNELKKKSRKTYLDKKVMVFEYGFAKWLLDELVRNGQIDALKERFPEHWKFIVLMVYCCIAYKSPLKNIPFHLEQSTILDLLDREAKVYDQKVSDMLFELEAKEPTHSRLTLGGDAFKGLMGTFSFDIAYPYGSGVDYGNPGTFAKAAHLKENNYRNKGFALKFHKPVI